LYEGRIRIPDPMHANESLASSALTGVFLAGGSYDFNLEEGNGAKKKKIFLHFPYFVTPFH
jgi:hypothetical protein